MAFNEINAVILVFTQSLGYCLAPEISGALDSNYGYISTCDISMMIVLAWGVIYSLCAFIECSEPEDDDMDSVSKSASESDHLLQDN